jgi:hypothetical protein
MFQPHFVLPPLLLLLALVLLVTLQLLVCPIAFLPLQGKRPSQYGQPLQQLESWARSQWPAAGERLYAWSWMVGSNSSSSGGGGGAV